MTDQSQREKRMPTPTFYNLPLMKRQRILDLALEAFASNPYGLVSISQLVVQAGIAKGSLYQYFTNKQDLYLYLLDYAIQSQLALLQAEPAPNAEAMGCFTLLRWQMSATVRVGLQAPLFAKFLYRATTDQLPFRAEISQQFESAGETYLRDLLHQGLQRGEINPTIEIELAAFLIRSMIGNLRHFLLRRSGIALATAIDDLTILDTPEIERIYDQIIQLLQHGLGTPTALIEHAKESV